MNCLHRRHPDRGNEARAGEFPWHRRPAGGCRLALLVLLLSVALTGCGPRDGEHKTGAAPPPVQPAAEPPAGEQFAIVEQSCKQCHRKYRD